MKKSVSINSEVIKRLISEQIQHVIQIIQSGNTDIGFEIHEIRQTIKKIRALLKLIRDELGYSTYFRENEFFKGINQRLSTVRDHEIILHQAFIVAKRLPDQIMRTQFIKFQDDLTEQRNHLVQQFTGEENELNVISDVLKAAQSRILQTEIQNGGFEILKNGIFRSYKNSCNYLIPLKKEPEPEIVHDLRKTVKSLWFQLMPLTPLFPYLFRAYAGSLKSISRNLGIFRDISLFRIILVEKGSNYFTEDHKQLILLILEKGKERVYHSAMDEADKFFIEKPSVFVERLVNYHELFVTS